jgi:polyribonucleotide nucleotidyltransferase
MVKTFKIDIGQKNIEIEIGKLAHKANGSVTVRCGDTLLLVTAVASKTARKGIDFLPLSVDVAEKAYAAGKLPGGFFKREGRPGTEAVLNARLIDRPLRPLFPKNFHNAIQIVVSILSTDQENTHESLGIIGASCALAISDIPFSDPVGACNVGYVDGDFVINPSYEELSDSEIDLTVAGTEDAIMMVEAGAKIVSEEKLLEALRIAQDQNKEIVKVIKKIQSEFGKEKWIIPESSNILELSDEQAKDIRDTLIQFHEEDVSDVPKSEILNSLKERISNDVSDDDQEDLDNQLDTLIHDIEMDILRNNISEKEQRPDGRNLDQIRLLDSEVGYVPRAHGSSIFRRGDTHVLSTVTLASEGEKQKIDNLTPFNEKYFIHHYNFPDFSVGEVGRGLFTGRREIGHGALAERALLPVIPSQADFPYTIRVVSEVVSSNGSTSMASVCAGTLSLMDAGVPIIDPVAGIAMGLIINSEGKYSILTDIQGAEDHFGDMDFKVAGTKDGVTALQMDIKVKGITFEIMEEALGKAKIARLTILDNLVSTIDVPRENLSKFAPKLITINIPKDKIGAVIGSGGSVIRGMIEEFEVSIDINDDGKVVIGGTNDDSLDAVRTRIDNLTREIKQADVFEGKVVRIMPFGAFVELLPGKDGLLHISELGEGHVDTVESVVNIGDEVKVIVKKVDDMGRVDLSTKIDHYLSGPGFEELAEEKNNRRNRNSRNRDNDSRRRSGPRNRNRPRPPDLR